jgi:hypothetical protein
MPYHLLPRPYSLPTLSDPVRWVDLSAPKLISGVAVPPYSRSSVNLEVLNLDGWIRCVDWTRCVDSIGCVDSMHGSAGPICALRNNIRRTNISRLRMAVDSMKVVVHIMCKPIQNDAEASKNFILAEHHNHLDQRTLPPGG